MSFVSLKSRLFGKLNRRQPVRCVPVLHGLEARCLLSTFNEYPVPDLGHGVNLSGITAGPDGNVWFTNAGTDFNQGEVDFITPDGAITAFPQGPGNQPSAIITGADGNLYFGGFLADSFDQAEIGRITPDGTATTLHLPSFGGFLESVQSLTVGPDGNVWFGQGNYTPEEGVIGEITPDGQATSSFIPHDAFNGAAAGGAPSITAGPDGNLWFIPSFVDGHYYIERVTPDREFNLFETPGTNNQLRSVTAGSDGNLWATAVHFDPRTGQGISASIDQITPDGQFTEFSLPDASHVATSIALGPDGNLWFTEPNANQIGMMTQDGQLTEYAIPTANSKPQQITAGPDGNIWFTEAGSSQIGELVLNGGTGPAGASSLAQALRTAAVDAVFTPTPQESVNGGNGKPSAAATVDGATPARLSQDLMSRQTQPAVAGTSGVHYSAPISESTDIAGLADVMAGVL